MTRTIAVAGKGGVGKTTISALLVEVIRERGKRVLAIDADPSSNLNLAIGLPLSDTVGDVREEMLSTTKAGKFPAGIAKQDYLDVKIQQSLVESGQGIDLLAMGRPEGPGCYCAANNMLRRCIDQLAADYDYVVIDNEAGLEHISRQTTRDVDALIVVTDPSVRGIVAAGRVKELIGEIRAKVGTIGLVVNRVRGDALPSALEQALAAAGFAAPLAVIPDDPAVATQDAEGAPLTGLPEDSAMRQAVKRIFTALGI